MASSRSPPALLRRSMIYPLIPEAPHERLRVAATLSLANLSCKSASAWAVAARSRSGLVLFSRRSGHGPRFAVALIEIQACRRHPYFDRLRPRAHDLTCEREAREECSAFVVSLRRSA